MNREFNGTEVSISVALKPTIYKVSLQLSDLNRNVYDSTNLTIALHPSETLIRMCARVIAFGLEYEPGLAFTKGLSETAEPDIWTVEPDQSISKWIELGQPDLARIKKASSQAGQVRLFTYQSAAEVWWPTIKNHLSQLPKVKAYHLQPESLEAFAENCPRSIVLNMTISDQTILLATNEGSWEIEYSHWQ